MYVIRRQSTDGDWRLYRDNGEQISSQSWADRPDVMDLVDALADEHNGASILGNPDARREFAEIVSGGVNYRWNDDTLPWQ